MNRAEEHRRFEELAVGHALSALEPEEEQQFLEHLASCASCERDVQEHRETVGLLALSADPVDPPPAVLQGILASLPPAAPAPEPGVASLAAARDRRSGRTSAATWLATAAVAAAVLALGAWNVALRADRDAEQQYGDRLASALRDLAEPSSRAVPLAEPEGDVVAVAVVQDRDVSLVVDGLAPNESGTSYVLWAQDASGDVSPVGAFDVDDPAVDVVQDLPVDQDLEQVTAFLVSNEPGDVAPPVPSGPVLASGEA